MRDRLRLLHLSMRLVAGRRFWIWPLVALLWPAFQVFRLLVRWRPNEYTPVDAQVVLIGFPLTVLAIGLGMRIIAGELDRRTLEIAYTVPGGTHRVWIAKLVASVLLLIVAEAMLAVTVFLFCTQFPLSALYGALQAAVFYLVFSMGLSALCKSEAAGALLTIIVLVLNLFVQPTRISPSFNPESHTTAVASDLLSWTIQNRIGMVLITAAVLALSFGRAEQRERMLSG